MRDRVLAVVVFGMLGVAFVLVGARWYVTWSSGFRAETVGSIVLAVLTFGGLWWGMKGARRVR